MHSAAIDLQNSNTHSPLQPVSHTHAHGTRFAPIFSSALSCPLQFLAGEEVLISKRDQQKRPRPLQHMVRSRSRVFLADSEVSVSRFRSEWTSWWAGTADSAPQTLPACTLWHRRQCFKNSHMKAIEFLEWWLASNDLHQRDYWGIITTFSPFKVGIRETLGLPPNAAA